MVRSSPRRRLAWISALSIGAASAIILVISARPGTVVGPYTRASRSGGVSRRAESPAMASFKQGDDSLQAYRLRAAEVAFRRALDLDPKLTVARWKLVSIYTMQMRRAELLAEFEALAGLAPLTFDQAYMWSQIRCSIWEPQRVTPALSRFLEADPGDRWVRLALAEGLRQMGRLDESEEVLAPLALSDPDARVVRARLALDRGDEPAARAMLAEGPADHAGLARLRGRMALARHDWPAAISEFRAALAAEPDHRDGLLGLARAHRLAGNDSEAGPLQDAVARHDTLLNLLNRAARSPTERDDPRFLREVGAACETLGLVPEARVWYGLAIARDPTIPEAQAALYRIGMSGPRTRPGRPGKASLRSPPPAKEPPAR